MNDGPDNKHTPEAIHFNPWRDFNDLAPVVDPFAIEPDAEQLNIFLDVVFSYCEGMIPLRGFVDKGQGKDGKPNNIWIEADANALDKVTTFAQWAWREGGGSLCHPWHRRRARTGPRAGSSANAGNRG